MYKKINARSAPKVGVQQLYPKYQDELAGNFFVYLSNDYWYSCLYNNSF